MKFKTANFIIILILVLLGSSSQSMFARQQIKSAETTTLEEGFINPPTSVRPWAYWVWSNGNVNYSQLTRDLEEIKSKGMGGFDIFDVGERFPDLKKIPSGPAFLGKESLEAMDYVINEASRLGLGLGLVTSSSWNAGGSWVKPEHANMALFFSEKVIVKGPARFSQKLPFPSFPDKTPKNIDGSPVFFKDIAVIAYPGTDDNVIKDKSSIKNLSSRMNQNGFLEWEVPDGEWVIVRFICTNTGKLLHMPGSNSQGLVIDHFNPVATKMHFQTIIDKLQSEIGSFENKALQYLYLCSYEVWGISWTPNFQQEFLNRRGYSIDPYLPFFLGMKIQNDEITDRFNYDFKKTVCDLIVDAHYKNATKISNNYGLQLCAESGGPGPVPVDALKALGALDIPRGEFWYGSPISLVKEIASAAHIYGKEIVDQEAFTSWEMWQEGPCDLKPLADNAFCNGMNKVTFHTFPHNPPETGNPGWAFYAGTHIGEKRVWWPKVKPFMDYLSRGCYLLRQGLFKADVCYYYGDQGYNYVPDKQIDPLLGYGYDYDVVNAEVILTRMEARNGKIYLPDGMNYNLLVLPDREDMDLDVLKKLRELVNSGITIVGRKPVRTNGLTNYPKRDEELRIIADELWGACDGKEIKENKYGKGKVIWGHSLREILLKKGIGPDFSNIGTGNETDLDYIHRYTKDEDIYFVRNREKTWKTVECTFRVDGRIPELWFPETGEIKKCPVYKNVTGGISLPLYLAPEEAIFVVFRKSRKEDHVISVIKDGVVLFPDNTGKVAGSKVYEIKQNGVDKFDFMAWKSGSYTIESTNNSSKIISVDGDAGEMEISGQWKVQFPYGKEAPDSVVLPSLQSWTENSDEGIKYFSGIATYHKEFEMPDDFNNADKQFILDLGKVKLLADVYLNGRHIGILWNYPYCVDITDAIKPGKNNLVIEVANAWSNRLTGDAKLPENERKTKTNIEYIRGPLMKGYLWKDAPLLESGLIGPVKILFIKKVTLSLDLIPNN